MPEQDLHSRIKAVHAIPHQVHTATVNGAAIDMLGFESIEYIVNVALAIDGDFTVTLEQSPDDGTGSPTGVWTAVPAAEIRGTHPVVIVTAHELSVARVGSVGKERHQRCVLTETVANTVGVVGVTAILGHPKNAPVAEQATAP